MQYPCLFRSALVAVCTAGAACVFALSGSGDSAVGSLDTVAPDPGTATIPSDGIITGETITYSGASDTTGLSRVELWAREDSLAWAFDNVVTDGNAAGSFGFVPGGTGLYHFDLVAEDSVGNRSTEPAGSTGTGQGSTTFTSDVAEWMVLE